jgi:hypothetical protein
MTRGRSDWDEAELNRCIRRHSKWSVWRQCRIKQLRMHMLGRQMLI